MKEQDLGQISFEKAMAELEDIVNKLQTAETPLNKAVDFYERASLLKIFCDSQLKEAEMRIEKVSEEEKAK